MWVASARASSGEQAKKILFLALAEIPSRSSVGIWARFWCASTIDSR